MTSTATLSRPTALTTIEIFFEAWGIADLKTLDTLVDPTLVISDITGLLYARPAYVGVAGAVRELQQRWHNFDLQVADAVEAADGKVFATLHATFEKYGTSFDMDIPVICELRDGLVISVSDDDAAYAA